VVNEKNGILITPGDENGLLNAMHELVNTYHRFDQKETARIAMHKFSYETVGREIKAVYHRIAGQD
jgi:glycogen synthase